MTGRYDSEAVESLRSLAAWLHPGGPEIDVEDRAAVRARWQASDKASAMLGELAGWDAAVLRQAAGEDVDDDHEPWPGRWLLVGAGIRAEQMKEPVGVTAERLAHSAMLAAMVLANQAGWERESDLIRSAVEGGEDLRAGWVQTLAGNYSSDPSAALVLAREAVEVIALVEHTPPEQVELAISLLFEAEAACGAAEAS